jgi:hypothetical protein
VNWIVTVEIEWPAPVASAESAEAAFDRVRPILEETRRKLGEGAHWHRLTVPRMEGER